ncbi:Gfo/Idh/MocA family protein [Amycolatopsis antarctica]|uniref:Gfo/Idh/MocA family protein n=1 Tax=Amycolatopsis antarctica TaxID=1854586 RepID=UPI001F0B0BBE|nr:Gfo/Idh/MocA family oxidoreductase [Amycolatopsis antarctica]
MDEQLRVGLVGAGPWAAEVHAPGLADHPGTVLSAVWTRRPEPGRELAEAHGATAYTDVDALIAEVDAVAFAVPPAVQAELAVRAAKAGRHVILEKPIAADLAGARRVAEAVEEAGVASLVMLTLRYATETQDWLANLAQAGGWTGGSAHWVSGALLNEKYSDSAWRHADGALADVGPHAIDLLEAALGRVERVLAAHRTADDLWHLMLAHETGATSDATLSLRTPVEPSLIAFRVYGEHGYRAMERRPGNATDSYTAMLDDFAALVASDTRTHPLDVHRGVELQRVLDEAFQLARP